MPLPNVDIGKRSAKGVQQGMVRTLKMEADIDIRFMAASKVLGEETIAGSAAAQGQGQQQRGQGGSDT